MSASENSPHSASAAQTSTDEARRLLKSTTALMSSTAALLYSHSSRRRQDKREKPATSPMPLSAALLYSDSRRGQGTRSLAPLRPEEYLVPHRPRGELPSARAMRISAPPSRDRERLAGLPTSPSSIRTDRGDGASLDASNAATAAAAHVSWALPRAPRHAMSSLADTYERQVDALLELATRCKLQMAIARTAKLGGRSSSSYAVTSRGAAPVAAVEAHSAVQLEDVRKEAGYVLAELRVTTCRMVQLLQHAAQQHETHTRRARESYEQSSIKLNHLRGGGGATALLSRYTLKFIEAPPQEGARARDSTTLWQGYSVVLKALTDFWRLPLPTASDPFSLRWFEMSATRSDEHSSAFEPSKWHAPEELREFEEADRFIKAEIVGTRRGVLLNAHELTLPSGVEQGWHAAAALLYGSSGAFVRRKAHNGKLDTASTCLCKAWRGRQVRVLMRLRREERAFDAATRLQRWWARQLKSLLRASLVSKLSGPEMRAQRAEKRRAAERRDLLKRRRAALAIAILRYPQYVRRVVRVQSHFRVLMARRASGEKRRRKLNFICALRDHNLHLPALVARWQRIVRRWYDLADLVWGNYRAAVNRSITTPLASPELGVLPLTAALRAPLEAELADVRAQLRGSPTALCASFCSALMVVAYGLGTNSALQGVLDRFAPERPGAEPSGAADGEANGPRAWLRSELDELTRAEDAAAQRLGTRSSARGGPLAKPTHVLQALSERARERQCKLRALQAARRLVARLSGLTDALGGDARVDAASRSLACCVTDRLADPEQLTAEEALAAEGAGRERHGNTQAGPAEPIAPSAATAAIDAGATGAPAAGADEARPWARQQLAGLYGHLVDCGERLEAEAAAGVQLRRARALAVAHEARRGAISVLSDLLSGASKRASCTPAAILGRAREELSSRAADLVEILPQLPPAAERYAHSLLLHERQAALEGALRVLSAVDGALERERWQQLQHTRSSLSSQLALSTRVKPAFKAAQRALQLCAGKRRGIAELRAKGSHPPSYALLACELPAGKGAPRAEGAVWRACEGALLADLVSLLGCPEEQLAIDSADLAPLELRPDAAHVRVRVEPMDGCRLGQPRDLVRALGEALETMSSRGLLPDVAAALGVAREAPRLRLVAVDLPESAPPNVARMLRGEHADATASADEAREALARLLAEGKRTDAPAAGASRSERKRVAHEALGREAVVRQLATDATCPPADEPNCARRWLPRRLDALQALVEADEARAAQAAARYAGVYAERRRLKARMCELAAELRELNGRLPRLADEAAARRGPPQLGDLARDAYLFEKRVAIAVAREAVRLDEAARGADRAERGAFAAVNACVQMAPRPSLGAAGALVTPRMVARMAARLGISLRPGDGELFLLPIAVEALLCPLPLGWSEEPAPPGWGGPGARAEAPAEEAAAPGWGGLDARAEVPAEGVAEGTIAPLLGPHRFRHSLSGEVRGEHPLLGAFRELVEAQRKRRHKLRKWAHLEGWMQFATQDGQLLYVDMSHAQLRAQAQIPLILAPAVAASLRRKQLWAKGAATHGVRMPALGSKGVAQLVAEQLALERLALRAAKEQHASARAAAELKPMALRVRARALRLRPCAVTEIFTGASCLEVDLMRSPELAWLVEMLLSSPVNFLPAGWYKGEAASPDGVGTAQGLYANDVSGTEEARGAHPFGIEARTVQRAVRAMASEALQTDGEYLETLAGDGSESKLGGVALFVTKFVSKK